MAMKAQNQRRMTLETLATIKNPPVLIARQANINNGASSRSTTMPVRLIPRSTRPRARQTLRLSEPNYWRQVMANGWTPERRARQAELIRNWKPWQRATGPNTPEGKARTARNGFKGVALA
jgi:hypothetical protein